MKYNYYNAIREDLLTHISEEYTLDELLEALDDPDELTEALTEDCWIDDAVTGNGSGSYTFNSYKAKGYVMDNEELCKEAVEEFGISAETVAGKFLSGNWEYFDVTIRCYLLYSVVSELVSDLEACREALEAEADATRETLEKVLAA